MYIHNITSNNAQILKWNIQILTATINRIIGDVCYFLFLPSNHLYQDCITCIFKNIYLKIELIREYPQYTDSLVVFHFQKHPDSFDSCFSISGHGTIGTFFSKFLKFASSSQENTSNHTFHFPSPVLRWCFHSHPKFPSFLPCQLIPPYLSDLSQN